METRFFTSPARTRLAPLVALAALFAFATFPAASAAPQETKQTTDAPSASTQKAGDKRPANVDEKALAIIDRAVRAMGGSAYLGVRSVVSHGYFSQMSEAMRGLPVAFHDYMVFPDRERTEFKGDQTRSVQVNTGDTGWIYDARAKKLSDIRPEQVEDFRLAMRTSIDNILRGWWRAGGASLKYVGRREAGVGRHNEVVGLTYPDGFSVEFEFDTVEGLPAKAVYKKQNAEGDLLDEEDRYAQFQTIGGVQTPFIVDHFRAGTQSSRVNYDSVEFNTPVPDSLFTKPSDIKTIKF
ncbi:MAG TPA: hypothetical protein VFA21_06910 [Pyrinomonadaceae bacterium]|nr:hypothetical protein [Pyrinomonadaceae bacterium]